tara:strand:- start:670 stop:1791 length:1122 start_codon:yes stop_codon:yes gene_type:complete
VIPLFKVFMADTAQKAVGDVLNSGFIGQGPKVEEFEEELKALLGSDYVATTNAATSAEHLALHLMKKGFLEDGDEVLASPLTCTATNWPILANNLKIKWVDVSEATLNMDLDDLERKISPNTKVIFLVHWGGYPVDLDRVEKVIDKTERLYGFRPMVIEDCAHALGSLYKGKPIGSHGNFCTFSFQAIKHITTGDGGVLVSPSHEYYVRSKLLRWYGIDRDNNKKDFRCEADIAEWGFKFHMNDIAAAIGLENLKHVNEIIETHRENASYYDQELKEVEGIKLLERSPDAKSSFWIYSFLVDRKDEFMNHMKKCEIMVSQVHERNDTHSCVEEFRSHLPSLDKITPRLISIPVGWWVSKEDREYIVSSIKEGW